MKLGNKIQIINGYPFDSSEFNSEKNGYPVIKIKELKKGSVVFTKDTCYVKERDSLKQYLVNKGDCLVALTGNPPNKGGFDAIVGRTCLYKEEKPAYLNQRVCKATSNCSNLLNKYLSYFLSLDKTTVNLASRCSGSANQANISSKDLFDLELNIPSVQVQQHIVNSMRRLVVYA